MANVSLSDVRDAINVSAADIPDVKLQKMIKRAECLGRAEALLSNQKAPAESLTLRSTVLDFGASPILAGDTVHVALPIEVVDADFRVLSVE